MPLFRTDRAENEKHLAAFAAGIMRRAMRERRATIAKVLVMGERTGQAKITLTQDLFRVTEWDRRWRRDVPVSPWPVADLFEGVMLRIPQAREEQTMLLHAAASRVWPGHPVILFGMKDEGIESAIKNAQTLLGKPAVTTSKHHGRMAMFLKPEKLDGVKSELRDWRIITHLPLSGQNVPHVTYPGIFAAGALDHGTEVLLAALPALPGKPHILDYGCGSGVIGVALQKLCPACTLDLLDVDTLATQAASENVPQGRTLLGDSLLYTQGQAYDVIISNPPIHSGKQMTFGIVEALVRDASKHLSAGGKLIMVAQKTVPVFRAAEGTGLQVGVLHEQDGFRVWKLER